MYKYIDINTIRFTLSSEKKILNLGILKDIYKAWQTPFSIGTRMVCALYSHCKKHFFSPKKMVFRVASGSVVKGNIRRK